ncbi:nuclear transport factor 2 family protein [Halobaculum magnesiiphilum]|uniref:Nuclear transport factor 2 family protein n=1 Tax=Halobaculum magnesiiphilum TaxID=1017351 RepID=A0A8T8W8Y2_9EURY|nr:nuclear transport factor 2 family protein [Halobaculum magnesiiphilum]QZP36288.1 nuclear transport factor 2 family protein [Halobaculum magnesiiphilum]
MSHEATARAYYRAIDAAAYDDLAALLAPAFVHERPDRTLSGREEFVRFMREERPRTDTEHRIDAVYVESDATDDGDPESDGDAPDGIAVRGRLLDDGGELFGFVDVFEFESADADAVIAHLTTYTD